MVNETNDAVLSRKLLEIANLMRRGELNQIIRPGKFYNHPVNNVEQILHFKDIHFEKLINKTLDEYVINVIFVSTRIKPLAG